MKGKTNLLTIRPLLNEMEQAFDSALPIGNNYMSYTRLMTTETVASLTPFSVKEIYQKSGLYYGLNASNNPNLPPIAVSHSDWIKSDFTLIGSPSSPFSVKEIYQKSGLYYGLNASNKTMTFYDRSQDTNPSGVILGMPGAGKSFSEKREMESI